MVEATPDSVESETTIKGTEFTPPTESADGSITKVIVKVGTGEDDSATIASVSIKKQETTSTPDEPTD